MRPPSVKELAATAVLAIPIEEASAKVRTGGPIDDEEDYALEVWAGVIPLASSPGEPRARRAPARRGRPLPLRARLPSARRGMTAQVGGGVHRAGAGGLDLEQLQ